jgi:hypothetical protein
MRRRTFLKTIFPTIFVPKLIIPVWKTIKPIHSFDKFIFPQINRVFPTLLVNELVSVQPMSMPSAQIFYMDFVTTSKRDDDRFSTLI